MCLHKILQWSLKMIIDTHRFWHQIASMLIQSLSTYTKPETHCLNGYYILLFIWHISIKPAISYQIKIFHLTWVVYSIFRCFGHYLSPNLLHLNIDR